MPEEREKVRLQKARWRPKRGGRENRFRKPIDIYFRKYPGMSKEELVLKDPRLLEAIDLAGDTHLVVKRDIPGEFASLVAAYERAFQSPSGIRKKIFRPRRFGAELMTWLLENYPGGMPHAEVMRNGKPEERKFYNDLKYAHLLRYFKKVEPLEGKDPVALYYELCRREGVIITRGRLKHASLAEKGGNAIYKALERTRDPEDRSRSLLEKHVPKDSDKLSAEARKRFTFED